MNIIWKICIASLLISAIGCKEDKPASSVETTAKPPVRVPAFQRDSAYLYIAKQVAFGPRVPGSEGHQKCKVWLVEKFESFGANVIQQDFTARIYTGDAWPATNIIAQFNPKHKSRILLAAHWDTRMVGEEDPDNNKQNIPIPGADDGGSGVGVLLEIGRIISENPIDLGVDIILFDAEDQGQRGAQAPIDNWCLGAQYWSRNIHRKNYKPEFGILLDMVGAKNPRFAQDQISLRYAGDIMRKVWKLAQNMGYTDVFVNNQAGNITDDHFFVNTIAQIPMIDIINQPLGSKTGFHEHWHTHGDDMDIINKRSLQIVGQVVTAVIYKQSDGTF